ncbi:hypothetical protein [uncultured Flavobacterium sp.]|uniref:hypothetical protein n=1 Tax=uncultured Flavobacterium sp. TaxID=165435 RepID=UPI0030EDD9F4|tara:strand:- start:296477 stop:296749 length:273 start_codon:yes stop_codon:yes gene_type:complete
MQKKDLIIGVLIGLVTSFIGCFLFITLFTSMGFVEGYTNLKAQGSLGKLITLGALLNMGIVFLLFKKNKDEMAKGVILCIFILTIYTLFA